MYTFRVNSHLEQSHEEEELQDGENRNVNVDLHLERFVGAGHILSTNQGG
jgi:hypothetical protein